jgi:hypothetical protein
MQIYEVAKPGILKTMGQDIKSAVLAPYQKASAILNTPGAMTEPLKAQRAMNAYRQDRAQELEPQVQQRLSAEIAQQTAQKAKQLAQQWAQQVKSIPPAKPVIKPLMSRQPTITVGGQLLTKDEGDGLWRGEDGRAVTDPTQAAQIDKAYYTGQRNVKGTVREATSPTSSQQFVTWSDQQLASVIPGTRQQINMDMIRKDSTLSPAVKTALDRVLKDPTNTQAVQDYFETAMKAMQQMSAQLKQSSEIKKPSVSPSSAQLLDRYVDSATIEKLQDLAKNPTYATLIKKELGII